MNKPKINSSGEKELTKVEGQIKEFNDSVNKLTVDAMNQAPLNLVEPQTNLSKNQLQNAKEIYLKPHKSIGSREKFNEDYRKEYEEAKQYVHFIAENKEVIGEDIDLWTKPFAGMPAEWWKVPVNKPIHAPRYVAEQIKRCRYHKMVMRDAVTNGDGNVQYYGAMAVDSTEQRLDAHPVNETKSIFMSSSKM